MDIVTMNRKDFSVEVKIIKSEKEKTFDVPVLSDNIIWFQLLMQTGFDQSVVIVEPGITIRN